MTEWMRNILESKQAARRRLQQLPFSEKIKLLEKLRDRSLMIARARERSRANALEGSAGNSDLGKRKTE
jgi:hypothetical protein